MFDFLSQYSPPYVFSALHIPNCKLWMDGGTISGLADAAAISTWTDRTANAYALTQTLTKRPLYKTAVIGGKPAVRFDGVDDLLVRSGAPPFSGQAGAIFAVFNASTVTSGVIFGSGDEGAAAERLDIDLAAGSHVALVFLKNGGTVFVGTGNTTLSTGATYVVSVLSDGATYTMFVNGVAQTLTVSSGTNNGDWWGDTSLLDNVTLGSLKVNSESSPLAGDVGAVLVYDAAITTAQRQQVERALGRRFGVVMP